MDVEAIDCPTCTTDGVIVRQACATCGECRWLERHEDGSLVNPVTGQPVPAETTN